MSNMNQLNPTVPMSAPDMAFFEMGGMRYLVMPLGPTPALIEDGRKASQMSTVPAPASDKDATADVAPTSEAEGTAAKKYLRGLKGIQDLFKCSKSTAYNIKHSGRIDEAISQIGNTFIVDAEKALELLKK